MVNAMLKPGLVIGEKENDLMDRATYLKFIVGLSDEIRATGLTQEDFSKRANTSKTNLSRVLNDKGGCSPRWRKKVCAALGTTEDAVIARGGRETNHQTSPLSPSLPPVPESMDIVASVATFAKNAAVTEEKLRFWKDIFEYIPAAICLLRDGVVLYQNQAHRKLCPSAIIGKNLCQTCKDKGDNDFNCVGCLVERTQETGDRSVSHQDINGKHYAIETSFIKINSTEYQVVLATQIDGCGGWIKNTTMP